MTPMALSSSNPEVEGADRGGRLPLAGHGAVVLKGPRGRGEAGRAVLVAMAVGNRPISTS